MCVGRWFSPGEIHVEDPELNVERAIRTHEMHATMVLAQQGLGTCKDFTGIIVI